MKFLSIAVGACATFSILATAETIAEINGIRFYSPYAGKDVTGVKGLVTAKGSAGFWIRSTTPDSDYRSSESIYVYGSAGAKNVTVGDIVTLNAEVYEYRSSDAYLYLTELEYPTNITVVSTGNKVTPITLGPTSGKNPPTQYYSSLDTFDVYGWDVLAVPNNVSEISVKNPVLQPLLFGLDFWESLSGELVTLKAPRAVSKPNTYSETWVVGNYLTTGGNSRGGLTVTAGDSNPEAIIVGSPLDGTKNPKTIVLGDSLADITGVVTQQFGYYYILPLTNLTVLSSRSPATPPPTSLVSTGKCSGLTFGSYNVENLYPTDKILPSIANHIATYLKNPTLVFVQEIQDNDGATDDGVVASDVTLNKLVAAIFAVSGIQYNWTTINPVNDLDGGAPGGNIRVAYLYNPAVIRLHNPNPGDSTSANQVLPGPELLYNPGRIDPENVAFTASRKPLAAAWETIDGKNKFFTVNVHQGSKLGGTTIESDQRPPVNGGVDDRLAQATIAADFIAQILKKNPLSKVIASGDWNEFSFVKPLQTFKSRSGLIEVDDAAFIPTTERYTYVFEMNSQQLDHMFISPAVALAAPKIEHIHVNTWTTLAGQISDHDPSVAKLNVCQ